MCRFRMSPHTTVSRSGSRYGSGRSKAALSTLKIAALAPIPSAMVATAVTVKLGFFRSVRAAYPRSLASIDTPPIILETMEP